MLALSLVLMLAACATAAGSDKAPPLDPDVQAVASYHIGVDDQLQISVWQNPELSVSVPVRPDGMIALQDEELLVEDMPVRDDTFGQ